MLTRLAKDEVDAETRASAWAHAESCEACAARLHSAVMQEDDEVRTALLTNDGAAQNLLERGGDDRRVERGDSFGRYVILSEIGSGGLGRVYSAYDPELDRKVGIKVLRVDAKSDEKGNLLQVRLLREARAMAKLSHPNVVTVYDVGIIGRRVFIAMELVEGMTLRRWVSANSPSWQQIRDVMVQAGRGLEAAHKAGLIHRDFKPSNVLVTPDGRAKVLDFGLARGVSGGQSSDSMDGFSDDLVVSTPSIDGELQYDDHGEPLTGTNQLMGTPGYISPEQYEGWANLDPRVDQFAFAVTLHEVIYRRRPFRGRNLQELKRLTLAGEIVDPPPRIKVPTWLRQAMLRGLATDRDARFSHMGEFVDALERDLRARKRQWTGVLAAGILSGVLGAGVAIFWRPAPPPEARSQIEDMVIDARAAAAKSYFVYPPANDPSAPTAYSIVLDLEQMPGRANRAGDDAAAQLRQEFSQTLLRLGDRYWETDGGAPFATDYYAAALMFDQELERASQRIAMTPGELAALREKAKTREFSETELAAAESLAALAEPDEDLRAERIAALYERDNGSAVASVVALDKVVQQESPTVINRVRRARGGSQRAGDVVEVASTKLTRPTAADGEAESDPELDPDDDGTEETTPEPDDSDVSDDMGAPPPESAKQKKAQAKKYAAEAKSAYRSNDLTSAERLYNRALSYDRGNAAALRGLTELAFDRGNYRDAVKYGEAAIKRSPKSAALHLLLGDAYFKVLDYANAKRAYTKAKTLGSSAADGRLKRVADKIGG